MNATLLLAALLIQLGSGSIEGIVLRPDTGEAVPNARVILGGAATRSVIADMNGPV